MNREEFFRLVLVMRQKQQIYEITRLPSDLDAKREAERRVDEILERMRRGSRGVRA